MWQSLVWSSLHSSEETRALIKNTCFNIKLSDVYFEISNRSKQREMCVSIKVYLGDVFSLLVRQKRYILRKK